MSYIPSHAMPHAYVHDEDEGQNGDGARKQRASSERPSALKIGGAALLGYLLYRALR